MKVTLVRDVGDVYAIKLNCRKKQVYWLEERYRFSDKIKSCDYGGKEKKTITEGQFDRDLLGVLGDSVYFLDTNKYRIYEMNVTNGNIPRTIKVDSGVYDDLLVVDKTLQPSVTEECFGIHCPRFGYCRNLSRSCQCEIGFEKNGSRCTDIDECLQSPCGPNAKDKCTNIQGSYKCSACDEGYSLYKNPVQEGRCVAYSDIRIRLVNPANNNTGRVEIFHPSFGWGTVCGFRYDSTEIAGVVCRQLGFSRASATRKNAYYGQGTGPTLLYNPQCTGDESYIWDCSHPGWNAKDCHHDYDVGVDCY